MMIERSPSPLLREFPNAGDLDSDDIDHKHRFSSLLSQGWIIGGFCLQFRQFLPAFRALRISGYEALTIRIAVFSDEFCPNYFPALRNVLFSNSFYLLFPPLSSTNLAGQTIHGVDTFILRTKSPATLRFGVRTTFSSSSHTEALRQKLDLFSLPHTQTILLPNYRISHYLVSVDALELYPRSWRGQDIFILFCLVYLKIFTGSGAEELISVASSSKSSLLNWHYTPLTLNIFNWQDEANGNMHQGKQLVPYKGYQHGHSFRRAQQLLLRVCCKVKLDKIIIDQCQQECLMEVQKKIKDDKCIALQFLQEMIIFVQQMAQQS